MSKEDDPQVARAKVFARRLRCARREGYMMALENVHQYKWHYRGGPTEDEFTEFYDAIEAKAPREIAYE